MSQRFLLEIIRPQQGKQNLFLTNSADVVIYGGAAGGGKTYALLLKPLYYYELKSFSAVFFRKSIPEITRPGGLWEVATDLYTGLGAKFNQTTKTVTFPEFGTKIVFSYLEREDQIAGWMGTQLPLICFDELTHFSENMFFMLLMRSRTSNPQIKPRVRATCNPDPDSWVRTFLSWWIGEDGYPIEERCGIVRYFIRAENETHWFASREEAKKAFPKRTAKSFTFISSNVYDNKIMLEAYPGYLENLESMRPVHVERFLRGNWYAKEGAGDYFQRTDFKVIHVKPPDIVKTVRAWDFAAVKESNKNKDPDYTVGLLCCVDSMGVIYVLDMIRGRYSPIEIERLIQNTAYADGRECEIIIPVDPGSAGITVAEFYTRLLVGYPVETERVSGSKEIRAKIPSAQAGAGNIRVLAAKWNHIFFQELENFPEGEHDDIVDTLSDAVVALSTEKVKIEIKRIPDFL